MAIIIPEITQLAPASFSAQDVLAAMATALTGLSNTQIDDQVAEGIIVSFTAAGEDQQLSFRQGGSTSLITCGIEPSGSLTSAGTSAGQPTGTTADYSGEGDFPLAGASAGCEIWIAAYPDAILMFLTNSTVSTALEAYHGGRIYIPTLSVDAPSYGQDGLGFAVGDPNFSTSAGDMWAGRFGASYTHMETNNWALAGALGAIQERYAPDPAQMTNIVPANFQIYGSFAGVQDPVVGVSKYCRIDYTNSASFFIRPAGSGNQGWLFVGDAASGPMVFLWDRTVIV